MQATKKICLDVFGLAIVISYASFTEQKKLKGRESWTEPLPLDSPLIARAHKQKKKVQRKNAGDVSPGVDI